MNLATKCLLIAAASGLFVVGANAQIDEICAGSGITPGLDSPFAHVPYVYGRVVMKGFDRGAKRPKVVVMFIDGRTSTERWTLGDSGTYCFRRKTGGGEVVVEVDGAEAARRTLPSSGASQQREDFEIHATKSQRPAAPSVVSAKFVHPKNEKTAELYEKTREAEESQNSGKVVELLKEIVSIDPSDFIAWARLGSLYFELRNLAAAEAAFRKSLEQKVEYTPAWIYVGLIRIDQKQFEAAVGIFKHVVELDPASASAFRLLGEAYLQSRQGTLGAEALNQALKLDPVGMAECHLILAHLYDLAGAKKMATREYKAFMQKVPEHRDKKKFEKYIKDNPE